MKFSLQNKRGVLTRAAYFIIGMAVVMGAFFTGLAAYEFFQWDPLDEYPIQVALSPRVDTDPLPGGTSYAEDYSIPVIYWDEDIEVNAIKCVKDTEGVVQTRGTVSWISDFPPGKIIEAGVGSGPRGPGCVNYVYMNTIPDAVKVELGQLKAEGVDSTEWHLTGSEIPISEDGEEGTPRSWTTTSFRIIHENAPKERD